LAIGFNNVLLISVSITAKSIAYHRKKYCISPQKVLRITAKSIAYAHVTY